SVLSAQESSSEGDLYELSPFMVNPSDNEGYQATSTLSGTRLNTALTDIAASVSVFTKEFLDDVGATSIQDAYLYSVNTENENEFAPNDTEGNDVSSTNNSRVRGLVASTTTTGFFDTHFRADTYNTERFTQARGPNSILYGVGSPAGLMNATLKRAMLSDNKYEFGYRFDSEDGNRLTADLNQVLIEDKLAVRIAFLDQDLETWKDPEVDNERRRFATATFRPFENTTIRVNWEDMTNRRSKSRARLAKQEISQWEAAGSPLYDSYNDRITYDNGATWLSSVTLASGQTKALSALTELEQFEIGINRDAAPAARSFMHGQVEIDPSAWSAIEDPKTRALYERMGFQALIWFDGARSVGRTDPNTPVSTFGPDDTLVPTNLNIHGLTSSTKFKGENYGITWEQKITENFYFELAYNHEDWSRYFLDPIRGENAIVYADVNYYIPLWRLNRTTGYPDNPSYQWLTVPTVAADKLRDSNGDFVLIENPNRGRYFVEGQLIGFHEIIDQDNVRATASYELDLRDKASWLGRHSFAALFQKDEVEQFQRKLRAFNGLDFHLGAGIEFADIADGQNNLRNMYYLDFPGQVPTGGENSIQYPGDYVLADPEFWPQLVGGWAGDGRPILGRREIEGKMIVLQSRFMEDRLITTLGLRNDKETQYGERNVGQRRDPDTGEWLTEPIPDDPYYEDDGNTYTAGVVFKATDWLSVFYNESDSYLPQGQYHTVYGTQDPLDPADGEGQDYGIMLNLMEGKLFTRISWYEQSANGALEFDWLYNRTKNTVIGNFETWIEDWWERLTPENFGSATPEQIEALSARRAWAANLGLNYETDYNLRSVSDFLRVIRDFETEGMEIEMFAKPIDNLDLVLTVGKNESRNLRSLPNVIQYVDERLPIYEKYYNLPRNPIDTDYIKDFLDPTQDVAAWNPNYLADPSDRWAINRTDSMGSRHLVEPNGLALIELARAEVGTANRRARKWRANLVANYRFTEGRLRGVGIGAAARWRDKSAIGYYGMPNPVNPDSIIEVPDTSKPIWGDDQLDFDFWTKYQRKVSLFGKEFDWRIQLNVRNLFDDTKIYAVTAHTDGSILEWEQKPPRTWMISNTITF
ncbi:MAG: hypothetical protein KJT03_08105, partial [Verrucomicrobiae bacterium]|nr:hypothetical protein [Verrucomicrobiae bacterium]